MLHYVGKPQAGADSAGMKRAVIPGYTLRRKGMPVADKYDSLTAARVKYCRYTDIYKVAVVGGDAEYLITNIVK